MPLRTLHHILDTVLQPIIRLLEILLFSLGIMMILVVFIQVLLRYLSDWSFYGSEELSRFIFTWFIFVSATLGLERGIHFAVDLLVERFPSMLRRAVRIFSCLVVILVLAVLVTYGIELSIRNWRQLSSAMQVPMTFVNLAIPTTSAIMILIALKKMLEQDGQRSEQA